MSHLLIVDGHAIIHRAYHALPPLTARGTPVNAVYGFFTMLHKAMSELNPTHILIAFDTAKKTFRKELLPEYQATRPPPPDDLRVQFELIRELVRSAQIPWREAPGFEADDIIGTVAALVHNTGIKSTILTGDKDILQLVRDDISVVMPKVGMSTTIRFTPETVRERFHVSPQAIPDLKALIGDPSDNYSSIKGIGPKTAEKLLRDFSSIDDLYLHLDKIEDVKLRSKLAENEGRVKQLKYIATIRTDAPITINISSLKREPFPEEFRQTLEKYEFRSLLKRYFPANTDTPLAKTAHPASSKHKPQNSEQSQLDLF